MDRLPGILLANVPPLTIPLAIILGGVAIALIIHRQVFAFAIRRMEGRIGLGAAAFRRARRPMRLVAVLAALVVTVPFVSLPYGLRDTIGHVALILMIVLVGWTMILVSNLLAERSVRNYRLDDANNLVARKHVTQVRVLRRTINILIGLITAAAVLLTFDSVQRYGVSLFASAGAAGLVLGFAARPVLSNLIAGIQIAITQPIRLEDVVIVEGEWGWIEEIFATYVVVRLWDWRRMVVPLSYFIEQPFQNWTRESAGVIGSVYWYVDYTLPVDEMRAELERAIENSPFWDGEVKVLQVVDTDKDTIHIRGLMSARTSPQNFDLRCEIREKMIGWIQREHPEALPRLRTELHGPPDAPARKSADPPMPPPGTTGPDGT
ncbi:mechanosensitive ion channel family protein [Palleronia sediminis]|uniref:Mechanosensitive ion channel family protein n=1 Tax=Palleronia sediminis TaxID=2547833 RepID=A0A4R6AFN4_9RHOB|nr:mechanosensitive ion channel family protein [Palleronia sediminis]TDL81824.1 mechanosensitive ion channel family protein [Palleronia sediminis]